MGRVRPNARLVAAVSVVIVGAAAGLVVASRDRSRGPAPAPHAAPRSDVAAPPDAAVPPAAAPTPAAVSAVAPATAPEDPFVAGERCVDEAMAWIARDGPVLASVSTIIVEADVTVPDGGAPGTRTPDHWFWYASPDALRACFTFQGRDCCFVVVGDGFGRVVDRLTTGSQFWRGWDSAAKATTAHRQWLRELAVALAPRATGARFRLARTIPHPEAPGGTWFEVERTAPHEPTRTIRFGAEPRLDRSGVRAIAPDRVLVQAEPAETGGSVEFHFGGWGDVPAQPEPSPYRLPSDLLRVQRSPDGTATTRSRATVRMLKVNEPIEAELLDLERTQHPPTWR